MSLSPSRFLLVALGSCSLCGASLAANPEPPQVTRVSPPASQPINDPIPGPFLAAVNELGELKDVGVVDNAIRSWSGPKSSAFYLCFQSDSKPINWTAVLNALDSASRELRSRGAAVVVIDAKRVCSTSEAPPIAGSPYVVIKGVLRG